MESLDNRWILQGNLQQCEQFEKMPNTLGLENMAGVFIVVGVGIGGGVGLIIIEMAYKKHQIRKQRKMELARHAADKWRGMIEVTVELNSLFDSLALISFSLVKREVNVISVVRSFDRSIDTAHFMSRRNGRLCERR